MNGPCWTSALLILGQVPPDTSHSKRNHMTLFLALIKCPYMVISGIKERTDERGSWLAKAMREHNAKRNPLEYLYPTSIRSQAMYNRVVGKCWPADWKVTGSIPGQCKGLFSSLQNYIRLDIWVEGNEGKLINRCGNEVTSAEGGIGL